MATDPVVNEARWWLDGTRRSHPQRCQADRFAQAVIDLERERAAHERAQVSEGRRAQRAEAERERLERRVAELEAALTETMR
jgi:hypothetical protein